MNQSNRFSNRFRFTIAALLFVILCVAGLLAGYRWGFQQGYVNGNRKRESENPFPVVYPVADLVNGKSLNQPEVRPDYDSLTEAIMQTVAVETWTNAGGQGNIESVPTTQTLIINQTRDVHEQIVNLLRDLRQAVKQ